MPGSSFASAYDEDTRTLTLSGDLDEAGAHLLRQQLAALMAAHNRSLVMDLSGVASLPSTAIGVIAAARADMRARFQRLELVAAPGSVARVVLPRCGMSVRDQRHG